MSPAEVLMKKELKPLLFQPSPDLFRPAEVLMKKELKRFTNVGSAARASGRSPDEEGTETTRPSWINTTASPAEVLMKKELKRNASAHALSNAVRPKS